MPTPTQLEGLTNAEAVLAIKKEYGLTWDALGAAVGRSGRMMRKIARGETSGQSYMAALKELHETGKVTRQPPRRRSKDGQIVKVRAGKGKMTTPSDTRAKVIGKATSKAHRLKIHPTQHLADGGKIDRIEMPHSKSAKGRVKGWKQFTDNLRRTTRSQSREDKRMRIRVTAKTSDGQIREFNIGSKGGYHASDVLSDIRKDHGGSAESWVHGQLESVYADSSLQVVGVQQTEFSATRSKEIRKMQDDEGTRRGAGRRSWASFL